MTAECLLEFAALLLQLALLALMLQSSMKQQLPLASLPATGWEAAALGSSLPAALLLPDSFVRTPELALNSRCVPAAIAFQLVADSVSSVYKHLHLPELGCHRIAIARMQHVPAL